MNSPFDNLTKDELNIIVKSIMIREHELETNIQIELDQDIPDYALYEDLKDQYESLLCLLDKLRGE